MTATSDAAQAFLRRNQCYAEIRGLFHQQRPSDADLARVSTVAEVAIDVVFQAHHLDDATCTERHMLVKDYAECASLYAFVLAYRQGYEAGRAAQQHAA